MKPVIIGDGPVAMDIHELFERGGLSPIRVAVADVARSATVCQADCVIDASSLPPEAKRELYRSLVGRVSPQAILCTDESVVPRSELIAGFDADWRNRFAICHFFIPTAHLTLVELVGGDYLDAEAERQFMSLLTGPLQRSVMPCPDAPGFVANRLGLFVAFRAVHLAITGGLRPDQADGILAAKFGLPRLGAFGLFDLVGFDVMIAIAEDLRQRLPPDDAWQACDLARIDAMRRARNAASSNPLRFYRKDKATGARQVLNLATLGFTPCGDTTVDASRQAAFVEQLRNELVSYCTMVSESMGLAPEAIDVVLCKGFGWRQGPFALLKAS